VKKTPTAAGIAVRSPVMMGSSGFEPPASCGWSIWLNTVWQSAWLGQRKPSCCHLERPALISCYSSLFNCCSEFTDLIPNNGASINAGLETSEADLETTNTLFRM